MKRISPLLIATFTLLAASSARALNERIPFYEGARGLAMGGAQIGVVNDETALLVNPAALGKLRDFYGTVFDPDMDFSNAANGMYQKNSFTQPFTISAMKDSLVGEPDIYYHGRAQVFPSLVSKNFGIGIFTNYILDGVYNSSTSKMDMYYRNDLALALGYNLRFFDGRVKLGFGAKLINRIEMVNSAVDPTGALDLKSLGATEGTGLSTDAALILSAPWALLPSLTAVVKDVGNTAFNKASGLRMTTTNQPNTVPQEIDVAASIFPIHTNFMRSAWTIEYQDVTNNTGQTDRSKLIHGGFELNFGDVFFVRAGYNERYYTGGFEIASERYQFQVTSYSEEIGTQAVPQQDRRTDFKFAFRY